VRSRRVRGIGAMVFAIGVVVAANVAADAHDTQVDLSVAHRFTLSPETRALIRAVHAPLRIRAFLANPYFVPDRGFLRALCRAAARGVDVRLLVPARSDHAILDYAARATFTNLLRAGVRIFQHRNVVHSKALLVPVTAAPKSCSGAFRYAARVGNSDIVTVSAVQLFAEDRRLTRTRYTGRAMSGFDTERSPVLLANTMCG